MREILGPRTLTYVAPDGREGEIDLVIAPGPSRQIDLGDGETLEEVTGTMQVTSDWFEKTFSVHAADDIQLIFQLIWFSDIYVQKICRDNGYELYKNVPGDVNREFGVYS